ncbi:MAG: hypothetical protein QOC60_878, partial [Frankiaceae bacterium]|nr:hypothetical protein [Frankiaceae bacterium]
DESKRQARARVRAEAKAAAKNAADAKAQAKAEAKADAKAAKSGVRAPVDAIGDEPPARAKRHRRSKHSAVDVAKAAEVVQEAPPALINQDGWLTTVEDSPAEPMQAQPVQAVQDVFQPPTPAYAVPQQQSPDNQVRGNQAPEQDAPVYAMAGAPAQHAEAAVAAPQAAAAPTSFNELMTAPPAPAVPEPVVPELPIGPYTYGARTILPGK